MQTFDPLNPSFQRFLARQKTAYTKELIPFIQSNCQPYLVANKNSKHNLYLLGNGFSTIPSTLKLAILQWQVDRFGFSMPNYFTLLNKTKLGKILERVQTYVSYSTSKSLTEADIYVFPIGNFRYFWSPLVPSINLLFKNMIFKKEEKSNFLTSIHESSKLKSVISAHSQDIDILNLDKSTADEIQVAVNSIMDDLEYRSSDFYKGYNSGNEMVIEAVGFYMAKATELDTNLLRDTFTKR